MPDRQRPDPASNAQHLRWHATLQSLSLRVSAASIPFAPTLDDCGAVVERMREELAHLEHSVALYEECYGDDLRDDLASAAARVRAPETWREAAMAQLVLGLACQAELRRRLDVHGASRVLLRQLADKGEHVEGAKAALRASSSDTARREQPSMPVLDARRAQMQTDLPDIAARWLALVLPALDERTRGRYLSEFQREVAPMCDRARAS